MTNLSTVALALLLSLAAANAIAAVKPIPRVEPFNQTFSEPTGDDMLFDRAKGNVGY